MILERDVGCFTHTVPVPAGTLYFFKTDNRADILRCFTTKARAHADWEFPIKLPVLGYRCSKKLLSPRTCVKQFSLINQMRKISIYKILSRLYKSNKEYFSKIIIFN